MNLKWLIVTLICCSFSRLIAQEIPVSDTAITGYSPIITSGQPAYIFVDPEDHWLMQKAAGLLQQDLYLLTGQKPVVVSTLPASAQCVIIIGSLDRSAEIKQLYSAKKIDLKNLEGKWESFQLQTLVHSLPGIQNALVITGSDRRGTAYGVFELSRQMGVSPWYWWADVPVKKKTAIYIKNGLYAYGSPSVKYRGIFINDEAPAFSGWTKEKFGGVNHLVYEKVFELILRMKANYLWPAMWGNAFNDDDTLNPILADKYGIVMGTTHHEPMLRAQQEWKRYGKGQWNYDSNENVLKAFWKKGIENMGSRESIVTVGMRGDGDMPMTEGSNIALLERIVKDQRDIITEVTGKPASETPQLWALYKEVQAYYDKGMTVPDDVTLLLCDDNWGNIRRLPKLSAESRAGGYGIYYHFDYVGDPRNYKWLNTNSIPRVWEQMHQAYEYGADRIWIVNVGDIKPMEFPIQFFLDYAWNTKKWNADNIGGYSLEWSEEIFGKGYAPEIAEMMTAYTKYNNRRKPELLSPDTYSIVNYSEADRVEAEYDQLAAKAEIIYQKIPAEYKNAYYQLVLFPIKACDNLNKLYIAAGRNKLYAMQKRAATNDQADSVKKYFNEDITLTKYYNTVLSDGKWSHMMDQTHIGYTYWQQPPENVIPEITLINVPDSSVMGITIENTESVWPAESVEAVLPEFNLFLKQGHYIELFNQGTIPFNYTIHSPVSWINIFGVTDKIEKQQRLWVTVDWQKAPFGISKIPIVIKGPSEIPVTVYARVSKPSYPKLFRGFIENDGYVSMEASHYSRSIDIAPIKWQKIPDIGRTGDGMFVIPVTSKRQTPGMECPVLEYKIYLFDSGTVNIQTYFSPTLNFPDRNLQYGISIDDEIPQIINLHADNSTQSWEQWVANNIIINQSKHPVQHAGEHTVKYWMVDPGIVLQKIVVSKRKLKPSYLGPRETRVK